jgi:hypothetical protein
MLSLAIPSRAVSDCPAPESDDDTSVPLYPRAIGNGLRTEFTQWTNAGEMYMMNFT